MLDKYVTRMFKNVYEISIPMTRLKITFLFLENVEFKLDDFVFN